jgi:hypothetical protein
MPLGNPEPTLMRPVCNSIARAATFALLLVLLHGCSGSSTTSEVRGKVSYDGTAIEKGTISFFPLDGQGQPQGGEIKDGAYSVRMMPGTMEVRISMPGKAHQKKLYNTPDSPIATRYDEGLPDKYNKYTVLKLTVGPGVVKKDWDLTSK